MKRVFTFLLALALIAPALAWPDTPSDIFLSSNAVVKQHHQLSRNAAVKVITPRGHGSGSYIKLGDNYYVLTAKHVVRGNTHPILDRDSGPREVTDIVTIQAGPELVIGEVVFRAQNQDIALIKVPMLSTRTPAKIRSTNITELSIGDELVYSGYPSQYSLLTSGAQVSGKEETRYILQGFAWPGSSGCGIIDSRGRIRGILVAIGIEWVNENPQLLETVVWMEPINSSTWEEIERALQL